MLTGYTYLEALRKRITEREIQKVREISDAFVFNEDTDCNNLQSGNSW